MLVIEDEFLIALDLRSILDDLGYRLGPAATVPEALRLLLLDPPDATLLDLNLARSAAPVAEALTTGGMPFVIEPGLRRPARPMLDGVPVVAKPFWAEEIRDALLGLARP